MLCGGSGWYSIASSPLLSPLLGIKTHFSEVDSVRRAHLATWPVFLTLAVLPSTLGRDLSLAAWASHSHSVFGRSSSSWRGTSLGYVCNPSSSWERDTASQCHTSGIPASTCFIPRIWCRFHRMCFYTSWSLRHLAVENTTGTPSAWPVVITPLSEWLGHSESVPIAFSDAASCSLEELGLHTKPRDGN